VGNELLLGNTVNTNASWIAAGATAVGAEVSRITTIGDNLREISAAVKDSLRRHPHFLIVTGGIGPTFDDMTLKGVARALGRRIKLDQEAVRLIRQHYRRRFSGKPMKLTKPRRKMACIPVGSTAVHNPVGTAPGVLLITRATEIFCLPGVPAEAKAIFQESVLTKIRGKAAGRSYIETWLKVNGIMESSLAPIIDRAMNHTPGVYIKSHPRGVEAGRARIELHLSMFAASGTVGARTLRKAVDEMRRELRQRGARVVAAG
jgi:molybdenum cofactor synthesis domain-containing protein